MAIEIIVKRHPIGRLVTFILDSYALIRHPIQIAKKKRASCKK